MKYMWYQSCLLADAPVRENRSQIDSVGIPITVDITVGVVAAPACEDDCKVIAIDHAIAISVTITGRPIVADHSID